MIVFDDVTFTYPGAPRPVLRDVNLVIPEGELWLVLGHTGTGKSTLLRAVNGLVPHFTGGRLEGLVRVADRSTRDSPPRELAEFVGMVGQDPLAGFVTDVVEDELAYTMENLGLPTDVMRRRVEDVIDLLGLQELRTRPLATLSSGQQQRVAIGSVLTASPQVLVLDEPTSALDPGAAEEVLAALTRLVHDLGLTVLVAEHRLERIVQYADRVVTLDGTGRVHDDSPADAMANAPVVPPVVGLGRVAGWSPVPLTVRDARRRAPELRSRLPARAPEPPPIATAPVLTSVSDLTARFGAVTALDRVSFDVAGGEVVAVMGRNGAGKSTLLATMAGLRAPSAGRVLVGGDAPSALAARELVRRVALVPPDPGVLLYHETVVEEAVAADRDAGLPSGTTAAALDRLLPDVDRQRHPRDLSEGQRLSVALAIVLAPEPPLLLLDEPTRGLDYGAKARLTTTIERLAGSGHGVVLATHDVELVAGVASRVIVLANGEIVADGAAREVVCHSPVFAPQVAKVLAPDEWLTVAEVAAALAS